MHPKDCLSFKFRKIDRLLARQYTQVMAEASLQSTQFTLLTHIKNYGPISIKDLALKVGTDSSTMSRNLKILINERWVKFMTNQDDARTHLVQVSRKGSKKHEEARLLWEKQQTQMIKLLGKKRVGTLNLLLDQTLELLLK